jgi:hypothetical protein
MPLSPDRQIPDRAGATARLFGLITQRGHVELTACPTGDRPIPVEGTDEEARADAMLRVLGYLKRTLE